MHLALPALHHAFQREAAGAFHQHGVAAQRGGVETLQQLAGRGEGVDLAAEEGGMGLQFGSHGQ